MNSVGDRYVLFCGVDDLVLESVLLGAVGLGVRAGQRLPGREPRCCGTWRRPGSGRRRWRSTAGTRRCCTWTRTSSWCSTSSWPWPSAARLGDGPRRRGCRSSARSARRSWRIIRKRDRARGRRCRRWPVPLDDRAQTHPVSSTPTPAASRRASSSPAGRTSAAGSMAERLRRFRDRVRRVPLGRRQRAARLRRAGRRAALRAGRSQVAPPA